MAKIYYDSEAQKEVINFVKKLRENKKIENAIAASTIAKIAFLITYPAVEKDENKGPLKISFDLKIKRTSPEVEALTGYNYIITVNGVWWDNASKDEITRKFIHTLLHIDYKEDSEGNTKWILKKHDIEEFSFVNELKEEDILNL